MSPMQIIIDITHCYPLFFGCSGSRIF